MNAPVYGVNQATPARLNSLSALLIALPGECLRVLEIGSYEGFSALHWSHAIAKAGRRGDIFCVDPWEPYIAEEHANKDQQRMNTDLRTGAVFERFQQNTGFAHPSAPISYFRGAITSAPRSAYDFIYIDGSHGFADVMTDLHRAAPQLREGGILCGDDLESQIEGREHERTFWDLREQEWSDQYLCHPGVTMAVWTFFERRVWCIDGAWAVRKVTGQWRDAV